MTPAFDDPPIIELAESPPVNPQALAASEPVKEPGGVLITDRRGNDYTRSQTIKYRRGDEKRVVDTLNSEGWTSKPAVSYVVFPDPALRNRPRLRRPSPLSRFIGIDLDP